MDTRQLIETLADEGASRPLLHPIQQSALWITGIMLYLLVFLIFDGFRPELMEMLAVPVFLVELLLLVLTGISASFAAFCLSRPDGFQLAWIKYAPFPLLLIWLMVAFIGKPININMNGLWYSVSLEQFDCPLHIIFFSAIPGIVIFYLVRMGAAIQYYWAGAMSTLSVTTFAYLFMRLVESNDDPAHLILWHALPIALMCLLGMVAGRKALRWR